MLVTASAAGLVAVRTGTGQGVDGERGNDRGHGEHRVLALHGWFGSARGWGALPDYLNGDDYTWAFMDLRGYGRARAWPASSPWREAAADALALADELGWERFSLVGHSMTGQAIQHVLLAAPDRVRRLVAITPVPAVATPFDADGWALFSGAAENPGEPGRDHQLHHRQPADPGVRGPSRAALARRIDRGGVRRLPGVVGQGRLRRAGARATRPRSRSSWASTTRRCPPP